MQLSEDDVKHIAKLARIAIKDDEITKYRIELSAIFEYVEQLNELDTEHVEPTSQVTGLENRWREDVVESNFTREEMLASAIETAEDHMKVKQVFVDEVE